jgi:SOS response regulatory protein OraA/RecX
VVWPKATVFHVKMENDISLADQNSTCLSTSSSTSSTDEDIQPEVRNQFMKLAEALKETNQNLLTFEFMLGQYRKLARIEPFNTNEEIQQSTELEQQQISDKSEVLDQLRCLTEAVNNLQDKQHPASMSELSESVLNNQESSKKLIDEVFTIREQMKQLSEANVAAGFLRSKVADLEISLNEKNLRIDGLAASHKRVTAQLSEERDRCQELDRKLESEKRAAAQVRTGATVEIRILN